MWVKEMLVPNLKENQINEQRKLTQITENLQDNRKSGLLPRISASVFSGFKSDRTFLKPFTVAMQIVHR